MLKEFEGVNVLFHTVTTTTSLHTKKAVRVPDNTKGMKIAAMGDSIKILQAAGASPVNIPASDWYLSLEKGVIEGIYAPINVLTDRGIEVLTPNHVDVGIGQSGNTVIMNLEKWNSLPPDIKKKFEELNPWGRGLVIKANEQVVIEGWKKCQERGHTIIKPTPEESKLWIVLGQPGAEEWIKNYENKGPTREMFEYAKKLIEETK
jgi:TRAP-type C4-dicarboxylate transport system substrate-binding protein